MGRPKFDSAVERDENGLKTSVSPLYLTYFMLDWTETAQAPTEIRCITCAGQMVKAEPVRDKKGGLFDGIVCHYCKVIIWSRRVA